MRISKSAAIKEGLADYEDQQQARAWMRAHWSSWYCRRYIRQYGPQDPIVITHLVALGRDHARTHSAAEPWRRIVRWARRMEYLDARRKGLYPYPGDRQEVWAWANDVDLYWVLQMGIVQGPASFTGWLHAIILYRKFGGRWWFPLASERLIRERTWGKRNMFLKGLFHLLATRTKEEAMRFLEDRRARKWLIRLGRSRQVVREIMDAPPDAVRSYREFAQLVGNLRSADDLRMTGLVRSQRTVSLSIADMFAPRANQVDFAI